jgi:hypothetical protein
MLQPCAKGEEMYIQWQMDTFNKIIAAYENKLSEYNEAQGQRAQEGSIQANPGFFRKIENIILRKHCISYISPENYVGQQFYKDDKIGSSGPVVSEHMDRYAAFVKFIEQAFEWEEMSYNFYPFYWGKQDDWANMYSVTTDDHLFRGFLQSGMARVIVTVRPGFEEAVMYYMSTGLIWNGGQPPIVGDDLYLSIVEELKEPPSYVDEVWYTRVPSTLTVIQASSIGLNAEGLPCDCGNETGITNTNVLLGTGSTD